MTGYPHTSVWANGRAVAIDDIISGKARPLSEPEGNTFQFIREWFSAQDLFELQTSGSTGEPKRISVTREQMTASARLTAAAVDLRPEYNALQCMDAKYIGGKMMLVRSFTTGMRVYIVDPCANPLCKIPVDRTIHFTAMVPYQIVSILESKHPHLLDRLLICLIGGAPVDENVKKTLKSFSTKIFLTYGMTETISHIALQKLGDERYTTLPSVGIETDDRGCLVIAAPFLHEKIFTNDVVDIFNTNEFLWRGRYDNLINSGGIKVSPEILEQRIGKIFTRLKITNDFFIYGKPDLKLGEQVVLVIEGSLPDYVTIKELVQALQSSTTSYEVPKQLYESPSFVYTGTGKVKRSETFASAVPGALISAPTS